MRTWIVEVFFQDSTVDLPIMCLSHYRVGVLRERLKRWWKDGMPPGYDTRLRVRYRPTGAELHATIAQVPRGFLARVDHKWVPIRDAVRALKKKIKILEGFDG